MKKTTLESIENKIADAEGHLNFLVSAKELIKNKDIDVGDVAFHKTENNVMEVCLVAKILVPTFQMYKESKVEILATIKKVNSSRDIKVKYKDLYKYNSATKTLYN